ncbi:polysaccharide lyase family 4 protein [Hydnum rufescens UP504]|uniref:Polysaccharide lyase family 4 protein n=1 Tax=Hydnum rufescens UP504 TaxID=1448309 RepID=A0A9P6B4H5_9AGAM|nr:polysaccharide lyase family 4 protein [Hydnum rufescens UP504]
MDHDASHCVTRFARTFSAERTLHFMVYFVVFLGFSVGESKIRFFSLLITILVSLLYLAVPTLAAFGLSYGRGLHTVDTAGGLVFQVNAANGNIQSLQYNGFECQDAGRFSQIGSERRHLQHYGLLHRCNYMNSYHTQTEEYHTGTFGPYTLIFTSRGPPGSSLGFSFMATLGISGIVPASGHGFVTCNAQYWAVPDGSSHTSSLMHPGTYTVTLYEDELAVAISSVSIDTERTTTLDLVSAESIPAVIWRIGDADGTPAHQLRKFFSRVADVNNPTTIQTALSASQIGSRTLRIRTTSALARSPSGTWT